MKFCSVAVASSALVGASVDAIVSTQAAAIVQKKHPPKHKKSKAPSVSKELKDLASGVAAERNATFEIVYTTTTSGHTESVTFAQSPPKFLIKIGSGSTGGSVIYSGSQTLYCSANTCISEGKTSNPLKPLESLVSPTTAKAFFDEANLEVGTKGDGYSVSFSSEHVGGLSSECATVKGHGQTDKDCVAKNGLLTYSGSAAGSIVLTSYTSDVPSTAFSPPSGSTVITEPSS